MQKKSNTQKILSIWMKACFEKLTTTEPQDTTVEALRTASKPDTADVDRTGHSAHKKPTPKFPSKTRHNT